EEGAAADGAEPAGVTATAHPGPPEGDRERSLQRVRERSRKQVQHKLGWFDGTSEQGLGQLLAVGPRQSSACGQTKVCRGVGGGRSGRFWNRLGRAPARPHPNPLRG